jgi:hypothetical protein
MTIHYKASGRKEFPPCLTSLYEGALTKEQWLKYPGPPTITDIMRVTCPACLKQIAYDINRRLGN